MIVVGVLFFMHTWISVLIFLFLHNIVEFMLHRSVCLGGFGFNIMC